MYQQFYNQSDMLVWPVMALLIFVMIFAGVLAYVFLGLRDKDKIDRMASLPFESVETETDHEDRTESGSPVATDGDVQPDGRTR